MRRINTLLVTAALSTSVLAHAAPGDLGDESRETFRLLDGAKTGRACLVRGAVCVSPATAGTVAGPKTTPAAMPTFARAATVATSHGGVPTTPQSWTLELDANLARPALAGNALFLFYDLDDPESLAQHQVTAMHQAHVRAGRTVAARATLSPDDGFVAGRTYRLQVVQLIAGREVVLAQGDFSLR